LRRRLIRVFRPSPLVEVTSAVLSSQIIKHNRSSMLLVLPIHHSTRGDTSGRSQKRETRGNCVNSPVLVRSQSSSSPFQNFTVSSTEPVMSRPARESVAGAHAAAQMPSLCAPATFFKLFTFIAACVLSAVCSQFLCRHG
jgi:hypothetical protein